MILDLLQSLVLSAGTTSVILLFSSLMPGAADIGVILLIQALTLVMILLEQAFHVPGMREAAENINAVIFLNFDVSDIKTWRDLCTIEVGRYFAVLLVCLTGATVLINQKEISYGS